MQTALSSKRSWIARIAVLAMVASLMAIAAPAGAAIDTTDSCPASITDTGPFTDLAGVPAAAVDAINCIADYGISTGTSATTFDPFADVPRWQMALFLTRQAEIHGLTLPNGADQGFLDLAGVPAAAVTAINQTAQLAISTGTTATTFDPFSDVERWQMALFLTRLITGAGITLPSGADQGFLDLAGVPDAAVTAINQLAQLDIADGTTATTFDPFASVERWQMALFLARVLAADGIRPTTAAPESLGPNFISVSRTGSDTNDSEVSFVFDEPVTSASLVAADFRLLDFTGNGIAGSSIAKSTTNDAVVRGIWDTDDEYDWAPAGTVATDAAEDVSGNSVPVKTQPLHSVTVNRVDYTNDHPELVSIGDFDSATDEVTFTFDSDVQDTTAVFSDFYLVLDDGSVMQATGGAADADVTGAEVVVEFNLLSTSEFNSVVRAFVDEGAVTDEDEGNLFKNPPMAIDVSQGGNVDTGFGPNIESVDLSDLTTADGEVVFTFDRVIDDGTAVAGNFAITHYDNTGTPAITYGVTADVDGDEVTVDFGVGFDVVIYATALEGAVEDDLNGNDNAPDTEWISHTFSSGNTAGADLVSIEVSANLAGSQITVTLEFDEDVVTGGAPGSFVAFDDDGDEITLAGFTIGDDDGDEIITLVFDDADDGFDELDGNDVAILGFDDPAQDESGYFGAPDSDAPTYN